jgi:cytoskeleton protein RodZ
MADNWNVAAVADSKPQAPPEKPTEPASAAPIPSVLSNDYTLGKIMSMARESRGFSREQAAKASNIPGYYLTMIESDDYSSIADQLYLLPFLRRYASFVGLEQEEVASRFIRDVQRADMNPGRVSEPIVMIADRKSFPWNLVLLAAGGAVVVIVLVWLGYRHFSSAKHTTTSSSAPASTVQQPAPAAPNVNSAEVSKAAPVAAAPAVRTDRSVKGTSASAPPVAPAPITSKAATNRPKPSKTQ